MDAPPQALVDRLAVLQLTSPRDWRRAEAICRRLARDLPVFEEVWIDALVQLRRLTVFQANALREGRGDALGVGDFVLCDRLSGTASQAATYLAKPRTGGADVVLKIIPLAKASLQSAVPRLETLCEAAGRLQETRAVTPHTMIVNEQGVVLVSSLAPGRDARSLLVRRGALPSGVVIDLAQQLGSIVAEAHHNGIVHGDLRLENLRLTERNEARLVDFGVRCCVSPVLSIHEDRPIEWYQGTAPERIGTCAPATVESDIYAFGCLLWHLLAGRPPFPHGDRLAVLTAHRSKVVPCIRDFAKDVPPAFAETIRDMTAPDPAARPTDLKDLQQRFTRAPSRTRVRGRAHRQSSERSVPWVSAAVALVAICAAVASFADPQTVKHLLAMHDEQPPLLVSNAQSDGEIQKKPADQHISSIFKLPLPDRHGIIALTHSGPFAAGEISHRGTLTLRGPSEQRATVVIDDQPLHLLADEVVLENIELISRRGPGLSAPPALALVECQNLSLRKCRVETDGDQNADPRSRSAGLAWRQIDAADATGGKIDAADCVFRDVSSAFAFSSAPRRVRISNALLLGAHSLLSFRSPGRLPVQVELGRLTLRDVGTVVSAGSNRDTPEFVIMASDSILALTQGVLCDGAPNVFRWQGSGVVSTADIAVTTVPTNIPRGFQPQATAEGIAIGQVTFAGPAKGSDADSAARVRGVPQRAGQPAGVDVSRLPTRLRLRVAD